MPSLSILIVALISFALTYASNVDFGYLIFNNGDSSDSVIENFEEKSQQQSVQVTFVGDVMLARSVELRMQQHGVGYPFSSISYPTTSVAVVGNFEGSIPKQHQPTGPMKFSFSVPALSIPALSVAGFTHMSLANNHSLDFGYSGDLNTREVLNTNNLKPFGHQRKIASTSVVYINDVAVIGIDAFSVSPDIAAIEELLLRVAESSAWQVVYVHWGIEYDLVHSLKQEDLAKQLTAAGADMIIGHHPHVVQDVQIVNGVPVFYSLGNYIFDQYFSQDVQEGLQLQVDFMPETLKVALLPVSSVGSQSAPYLTESSTKELFLKNLASRSDPTLKEQIESGLITISIKE